MKIAECAVHFQSELFWCSSS